MGYCCHASVVVVAGTVVVVVLVVVVEVVVGAVVVGAVVVVVTGAIEGAAVVATAEPETTLAHPFALSVMPPRANNIGIAAQRRPNRLPMGVHANHPSRAKVSVTTLVPSMKVRMRSWNRVIVFGESSFDSAKAGGLL